MVFGFLKKKEKPRAASEPVIEPPFSQQPEKPRHASVVARPKRNRLVKRETTERIERQKELERAKGDAEMQWTNVGRYGERLGGRHNLPIGRTAGNTKLSSDSLVMDDGITAPQKETVVSLFPSAPTDVIPERYSTSRSIALFTHLPSELWCTIAGNLNPFDAANLALAHPVFRLKLGAYHTHLSQIQHKQKRAAYLLTHHDHDLPNHLFCFLCNKFHIRAHPGEEKLPLSNELVDVFKCPNAINLPTPRLRLTDKRVLPFAIIQLVMRHHLYGPEYGIPYEPLSRRWVDKESGWSHSIRFVIVPYPFVDPSDPLDLASGSEVLSELDKSASMFLTGSDTIAAPSAAHAAASREHALQLHRNPNQKYHVLMRVQSQRFTPPNLTASEERLLLYSRNDYAPYFSVCAHWNGPLMPLAKCALHHVPRPAEGVLSQLAKGPKVKLASINPNQMPRLCDNCRPLRRCSACPTEYLLTVKLVEDVKDPEHRFKHALGVTRWSDLGDASAPWFLEGSSWTSTSSSSHSDTFGSREWAAIAAEGKLEQYQSFNEVGRLTLCSRFEMAVGNEVPGERVLPLEYEDSGADTY